ncbi:hypothetical protein [Dongia sp.]|uniref:hypothetical protein n=1 Tax=Dongia sp. TaxID=1977262 RepID=UPI0035B3796D
MRIHALLLLPWLAACSSDLPPVQHMPNPDLASPRASEPAPVATPPVSDSMPEYDGTQATIANDVITVTVSDPLPAKAARLMAPDGQVTQAIAIDTERHMAHEDNGLRPSIGVGVAGGSSSNLSTGIGIGFPLFGAGETRTYSVTESRITFRLPDPAEYRRDWQRYAIAVDLDDGVNRRTFQMLPPAPPSP